MNEEALPARRHQHKEADGTIVSYSIPAGVTDEAAAAEVAKMRIAMERGYTQELRFHDRGFGIDVRWWAKQPAPVRWLVSRAQRISRGLRYWDNFTFWCKCRWLDVYWFVKDRRP